MSIKPEDRPKLIGLVAGLVGVLAYVLIVLVPRLTAGAAPAPKLDPPAALTAASAPGQAPGAGTPAAGDASAALPDDDTAPVPAIVARDTFTPPPATAPAPPPAPSPGMRPSPGPAQPLAPVGPGPLVFSPPPPAPVQTPAAPVEPPLPPIELKGVILGEPSMAVISINGEVVQRQVGDTVVGGVKLTQITDAGISVRRGKKDVAITVGHMMPGTTLQGQPSPAMVAQSAKTQP